MIKHLPANPGDTGSIPRLGKSTPVFLLEKSHRERSLEGYSPWGLQRSDTAEHWWADTSLLSPGLLGFIGRRRLTITSSIIRLASYRVIRRWPVSVTTSPMMTYLAFTPWTKCVLQPPHHSSFLKVYLHISCPLLGAPSLLVSTFVKGGYGQHSWEFILRAKQSTPLNALITRAHDTCAVNGSHSPFFFHILFFIYLTVPDLSCGAWDP